MDKMADAASSGIAKMSKLTHVRVVEEGDLNTDKESLFSSVPGSKVLVKLAEGVEKLKSKFGGSKDKEAASKDSEDMYGSISVEGGAGGLGLAGGLGAASKVRKASLIAFHASFSGPSVRELLPPPYYPLFLSPFF